MAPVWRYTNEVMPAVKATFTLDNETVNRLASTAEILGVPKSEVVRRAIDDYHRRLDRIGEAERQRALRIIREVVPAIPARPREEVEAELAEIRAARRGGGRLSA
jgi:predicted transcriptional regulator